MVKRALIILALVTVVALPFIFRPKQPKTEKADDTLIIITPHNEAIRHEYELGFKDWWKAKTGRTVYIDWRVIGGTTEIARYLEGEYSSAFENYWTNSLHKPWSLDVQSGFVNPKLGPDSPAASKEARQAFLESEVGCGLDLFYGGGNFDFDRQAQAGRIVDSGVMKAHPDWFTPAVIPHDFGGEEYWDRQGRWFGCVLSSYGILFNRDALLRLGLQEPQQWADLGDPRYVGEIALCDPTKSGSISAAFENVIQQQMHFRWDRLKAEHPGESPKALEKEAVSVGWQDAMKLLQRVGANARYFTDTSQKPPIDVATGDCAAGMCIDFYGHEQEEAVENRGDTHRLGYVSPDGGSTYSVDPIALLRGAPHRQVAVAFIEYVLSLEGQKLWNFKPGTPDGPKEFALRRMPVRRDFYDHHEWFPYRSDPDIDPYAQKETLDYNPAWTGGVFRELGFVIRVMIEDTHPELTRAWKAIIAAPEPRRSQALAVLQDVSFVSYERTNKEIKQALASKNKVDEVQMARDLGESFRANYRRAEAIAEGR
jgi:iron(III) transport system substrate-binding protein